MRKIIFLSIFSVVAFVLPAKAQMHLKFNTQPSVENLTYKTEAVSSNLKLHLNTSALAAANERLNKVRMMFIMNFVYALTLGDFGNLYSSAIGFEFTYAYILSQQIMLTASLGYLSWILKNSLPSGYEQNFTSFPLMIGLRYLFLRQMTLLFPYVSLQLGLHFLKQTQKFSFGNFLDEFSESTTKFGFNAGVGLMYYIAAAVLIDFSIRYLFINGDPDSISNIGFHAGASYAIE